MPSVDCDQEDGDEAEAEAADESEDVDGGESQDNGDGDNAGNEEAENEGEDDVEVVLLVRGVTHDEETRAMNDDVVDDIAEEDSRGDARDGSATGITTTTTTTTKTATTAFLVHTPTVVRSARLQTTPGRSDFVAVPANEIAPPRSACT